MSNSLEVRHDAAQVRLVQLALEELRGGMDASQYKDYILTLLFVKYVSDKAKAGKNSLIDVPSGGSFDDMIALKDDKEIGDKINKIIAKLAEANDLQKVIDQADFNDEEKLGKGKEMQDRLTKLVSIFADLDFRGSRAEGDDLLGDAYEYLMRHFATESGKSKGQFYTPAEVSRILAKIIGIGPNTKQDQTVYDPTCGSGSLLLKVADEAPHGITIYGQEKDNATWALYKMNMILHGNEIADIRKGDTITSPRFLNGAQLRTFDFAVANPPFSVKSWSNGLENDYGRFEFGRPPEKNGDYTFLLHILKSLKSTGKAAVILPHGVLFRGNAEATIRKALIERGYIKGIIGLPPNLFYGTGIPACDHRASARDPGPLVPRPAPTGHPRLIDKWERKMRVTVPKWSIRRMKTKWGSCNCETGHIWFNVELAKKHPECLEYLAVHEMTHLLERSHGPRFTKLMDKHLPDWRARRDRLNEAPLGHEQWVRP